MLVVGRLPGHPKALNPFGASNPPIRKNPPEKLPMEMMHRLDWNELDWTRLED
jgi:hypothetical protein